MSLASFASSPIGLAASGVATAVLIPALEMTSTPFPVTKLINLGSYCINYYATTRPGRIDGAQQDRLEGKKINKEDKAMIESISMRDRSIVSPSGWAFIIWAPIFLGELALTTSSLFLDSSSRIGSTLQKISPAFVASQLFQSLWTAAFRPRFAKGREIYLSGVFLSGIAISLNRVHSLLCQESLSWKESALFLPLTLHFGWTTAAALVNWNGSLAMRGWSDSQLAISGHLSAILATAIGVSVTLLRSAPVYGGVIAWALTACATGLKNRISTENRDDSVEVLNAAKRQRLLCTLGACLSLGSSLLVLLKK